MDELHPVSFLDRHGLKVLAVDEPTVYFHNDGGIIFLGSIQQLLDGDRASLDLLKKTIEHKFQSASLLSGNPNRLPSSLSRFDRRSGAHLCLDAV